MFGPATKAADQTGKKAGTQFGSSMAKGAKQGAGPIRSVFRSYRGEITALAGAFAAVKVVGFLSDAIAEARDAAKVTRQTNAVIKATGGAAHVTAADVDRLATSLSNKAGVDDEVIAAGEGMLLTFRNVRNETGRGNDVFNQATQAALDMTAALHGGEVTQQGLVKSNVMLGKALNDPIRGVTALTRVGVTFTAAQREQIKTLVQSGRTMDAQKIILAELSQEFGGAAAAAADPWQKLSVTWSNVKESIGTALLPVMQQAATVVGSLAEGFIRLDDATGGWASKGALAAGAAVALGVGVAKLVGVVKSAQGVWLAFRAAQVASASAQVTNAAAAALLTRQQIALGIATERTTAATWGQRGAATAAAGSWTLAQAGLFGLATAGEAAQAALLKWGRSQDNALIKGHSWIMTVLNPAQIALAGMWRSLQQMRGANDKNTESTVKAAAATAKQEREQAQLASTLGVSVPELAAMNTQQVRSAQSAQQAADKQKVLEDRIKGAREEITQQKQAITDSIKAYDGLISKAKVTASEVVKSLHNQVANFRTYARDTQRLLKAGVDPAAIRELRDKGVEYVHGLATGSAKQLADYKRTWVARNKEIKGNFAASLQGQVADLKADIRKMQAEINRLKGKTVTVGATAQITLFQRTKQALLAMGIKGYGTKFLAKGGRLPGYGGGDSIPIMAEPGEAIVPKDKARRPEFREWGADMGIPGFATGGIIGGFRDPASRYTGRLGQAADDRLAAVAGKRLSDIVNRWATMLGNAGGGPGWRWQMAVLRNQFPGLPLISGFRPGAITSTGNRSYHALGRAVDIPPRWDVFRWISATYGARTKELIFTPAGPLQIKNGRHHVFSGGTIRQDHYNHVHWAMDQGGALQPGWNPPIYNGTGRPERVLPPGPVELSAASRRALARDIAAAIAAHPPVVHLDGQKVDRQLATARLWNERR